MTAETATINATTALQPREVGTFAVAPQGESAASSMMNFISFAVRDPSVDVAKLDALLRMQREVAADDAKAQFFRALHEGQKRMPRVKKDSTIDLIKDGVNKGSIPFASYEDVDAVVRPIYTEFGFSVTFSNPRTSEQGLVWEATWRHVAGHSETNEMTLPPDTGAGRNPLQARGSTNSYGKRYLVEDFWNIVREGVDDDGKRGGTRYIDDEQIAALKRGLAKHKVPENEFLTAMSVKSLGEIEDKQYDEAVSTIRGYKPRQPAT